MKVQIQQKEYTPIKKLNNTQPLRNNTAQTTFNGLHGALNYFATNTGVGACGTDLTFMVIPRTANEIPRGIDATAEAAFRESCGTVNHAAIGAYGLAAGALIGGALATQYGVNAKKIFTSPERVEALAEFWKEHISKEGSTQKDYLAKIVEQIEGFNTTKNLETGFVKVAEEDRARIVDLLDKVINDDKIDMKSWRNKCNERNILKALITESTGAETRAQLAKGGCSTVEALLDDIVGMTKAFRKESVTAEFVAAAAGNENKFLKAMSKFNKGRALIGCAVASGIGLSVQPINMWITKKRTGKTGFVGGSEGCGKDTSTKFLMERLAVGAGMGAMVLAALKCSPKDFLNKMAFKGMAPTLDQLKGIYGTTIIGRVLVTRSEDELRESAIKDVCGYLSWLVLGDFVNRGIAAAFKGKELLNFKKEKGKNVVTDSVLKSRSEVLREALRSVGITTIGKDAKTGAEKAMGIDAMIKELKTNPLAQNIKKATMNKLWVLTAAQVAGYAFTGLALGMGIPKLNIYMTRRAEAKRREKRMQLEQVQQPMLAETNQEMKPRAMGGKVAV